MVKLKLLQNMKRKNKILMFRRECINIQYTCLYRKSSQILTEQNTRLLKHREELLNKLLETTKVKLATMANPSNQTYKTLIQQLLVQAFIKMEERTLQVRCRECDLNLVRSVLPQAVEQYVSIMKNECNEDISFCFFLNQFLLFF